MLPLCGIRIIFFLGLTLTGARKIGCGMEEIEYGIYVQNENGKR